MHRMIMNPEKDKDIDHINREATLDNRKSNLRVVNRRQNILNAREIKSNNTSGYKNITFNKQKNKWVVYFTINRKTKYIGAYENIQDAVTVRNEFMKSEMYYG